MGKRKINAVVSLLTTVMLLIHAIVLSVCMLTGCSIPQSAGMIAWILLGLVLTHALISIDLALSAHAETETRKGKSYPKMNGATIFQRVSGILLIVFAALHVAGASGAMQPPHIVHTILSPLFFLIALAHTAISTEKAFITLGIGNVRFVKVAGIVIKVICAATLIAAITGLCFYVR
jgi:hypothetical protein